MDITKLIQMFCLSFGCYTAAPKAQVYEPYKDLIIQIARNPSREAAQTEVESAWKPRARSRYAHGLRQFTDKTGKWAARTICAEYGRYHPYNPEWSLRCGIKYQEWLEDRTKKIYPNKSYSFIRKVAEQRYNGGGWVLKELRKAGGDLNLAKTKCMRAKWACKENYAYPIKISVKQKKYRRWGGVMIK